MSTHPDYRKRRIISLLILIAVIVITISIKQTNSFKDFYRENQRIISLLFLAGIIITLLLVLIRWRKNVSNLIKFNFKDSGNDISSTTFIIGLVIVGFLFFIVYNSDRFFSTSKHTVLSNELSPTQEQPAQKKFYRLTDYIGTTWYDPANISTIYFQDANTVIYHEFQDNHFIYAISLIKQVGSYTFYPNIPGVIVTNIGLLGDSIPLSYSRLKDGDPFLSCVPINKGFVLTDDRNIIAASK